MADEVEQVSNAVCNCAVFLRRSLFVMFPEEGTQKDSRLVRACNVNRDANRVEPVLSSRFPRRDKLTGASRTERVHVLPAVLPAGAPGSPPNSPLGFGENSTEI